MSAVDTDTIQIKEWRSIITLIVFVITNLLVLFPVGIPFYLPTKWLRAGRHFLEQLRVLAPRDTAATAVSPRWTRCRFPLDLVTAPIIADLFLLAILAIGRQEVHDGTVGANGIAPIDIMVFFFTLAYIAISIDATGLTRFLAFKVLQKGGKNGYLLYSYLFAFFFALATAIGNDPIVLSGTPFLAYMTRAARNIDNPRAWLFAQFCTANLGSAILVSSNPTNLVLAGSFEIKFVEYTANMIVPVVISTLVLLPCLYLIFRDKKLIPRVIEMDSLSDEDQRKEPLNPNIPNANGTTEARSTEPIEISLVEVLNPYLDKPSAIFGSILICTTLIVILVLNAVSSDGHEHPVFWVTLPAAVVMFAWDITIGWLHRKATRAQAQEYETTGPSTDSSNEKASTEETTNPAIASSDEKHAITATRPETIPPIAATLPPPSIESLVKQAWKWARATFPTAMTVLSLLPYALLPFSLAMFVLVQALVTQGWVAAFAYGWRHWIDATGTVGAIVGMGSLSVLLCAFSGTNIGTTILLCRTIQAWVQIEATLGNDISQRTFWATVYSMALGVNYGAFSGLAISASLAGLLWRDILKRKHIYVRARDFLRYNIPIIAISMLISSVVLVGEVYITRSTKAYDGTTT